MKTSRLLLALVLLAASAAYVRAGDCGCPSDCGCAPIECPNCHKYCKFEVETEKVKKQCFDVECKAICIPRIKLPWEKCCTPPKCAKVKYVHVLKTEEYECEHCKYKWTPVCDECGNGCNKCNGCQPGASATSVPLQKPIVHVDDVHAGNMRHESFPQTVVFPAAKKR
jgi:hypothetical protein